MLKSYITRPPRKGEVNGSSDHTFVNPEDVELYKDRMIAFTDKIDEYVRFATIDQLLESDLYIIDPNGIDYLRTLKMPEMADVELVEVYIRVPYIKAVGYARNRKDEADVFMQRYQSEAPQFNDYEKQQQFKYHVLNDTTFEEAADKLERVVKKELGW